ncbi:TatD family hydrolase [Sphingobacterium arenae]|uniref:TatD family hydrolase n=1 Tax=Sphingobacterium arenae TaxID=1280598 RepID=A0ABR7Y277_9SPHI|nr:TatD family hydrolase [Sphingobacterium arenae]MBD1425404.1 TatD family hydrolase [Sphingobacterium arenae]
MSTPYINIHTHCTHAPTEQIFPLPNVIISKDYLSPYPCSLGIHPWYIELNTKAQLDALHQYGTKKQVLAIGECGLDKRCDTEWSLQELIFRKQINYANSIQKPLIIHCVRAYQECLEILYEEKVSVPVIFHGFEKKPALAKQILSLGYFISLGSAILSEQKGELIRQVPLNKILLETDDKSVNIIDIYAYFCRVRKIEMQLLKEELYQNFMHIFNYPIGK